MLLGLPETQPANFARPTSSLKKDGSFRAPHGGDERWSSLSKDKRTVYSKACGVHKAPRKRCIYRAKKLVALNANKQIKLIATNV